MKPRWDEAEAIHARALSFWQQGDVIEAERLLRQSIQLRPGEARFHANLGAVLGAMGRAAEAAAALNEAVRLRPGYGLGHRNLGVALERCGRAQEAIAAYREAIGLQPADGLAWSQLGNALRAAGWIDQAVAAHRRAVALLPSSPEVHQRLAAALWDQGDLPGTLAAYRQAMQLSPALHAAHSSLLFAQLHDPAATPQAQLEQARAWGQRFASSSERPKPVAPIVCGSDRRIRVGYVSPDLVEHPGSRILLPILRAHDRTKFEVFCYSSSPKADAMTHAIRGHCEHWREIGWMSDDAAAERIRQDGIDVLVDAAGHMGQTRLALFAHRPAAVQVQLTYPATTGLEAMDWRITDALSDPEGIGESQHVERLLRLPIAWPYDPGELPAVAEPPALRNGYVTFGCLNRPIKVTGAALGLWAKILQAAPGSRLVLSSGSADGRNEYFSRRLEAMGIASRCELWPIVPRNIYLERFKEIDIALDPFPYNGEATTLDGLWMGVPLVTLAGDRFVSRRGLSHLSCIGCAQWVADSAEEYVQIAARLASAPHELAEVRGGLRSRLAASPLADGAGYVARLETALASLL